MTTRELSECIPWWKYSRYNTEEEWRGLTKSGREEEDSTHKSGCSERDDSDEKKKRETRRGGRKNGWVCFWHHLKSPKKYYRYTHTWWECWLAPFFASFIIDFLLNLFTSLNNEWDGEYGVLTFVIIISLLSSPHFLYELFDWWWIPFLLFFHLPLVVMHYDYFESFLFSFLCVVSGTDRIVFSSGVSGRCLKFIFYSILHSSFFILFFLINIDFKKGELIVKECL